MAGALAMAIESDYNIGNQQGLIALKPEPIDEVLSKLCYGCSHSLRGPMATIEGIIQLLGYEADTKSCLKSMNDQVEEMKSLTAEFGAYCTFLDQLDENNQTKKAVFEINARLNHFIFICTQSLTKPIDSLKQQIEASLSESKSQKEIYYLTLAYENVVKIDHFAKDIEVYAMNRKDPLHIEPVNIETLLKKVLATLGIENTSFINISVGQLAPLATDKKRLITILEKLIINAICFSKFDGSPSIDINIVVDTLGLLVKVKDNGIGIEKEYFDRVFSMFWRASNASSGSGFGLYLTGQIVSRMNGHLILESEIGSGSEFIFELPNHYYFDQT